MEPPNWTRKWAKHSREIFDNFAFNGYSDATICCGGKRIPVHKLVLVAASDFFKEIINSSTASHPIIIIENVDRKVLERLLMFIYRGEIVLRSSETLALFTLAKDLKIKGLSGSIGSNYNWLYDARPSSGLDVLNLNVFRKKVKPCEPQSDSSLYSQIRQILCAQKVFANRRRRLEPPHASSAADHEKTSVVRDKKYKSAFRNRSFVYVKGTMMTDPDDNEKEICSQLRNISLVKDSSKTFTPDAVKDLVGRLGSVLSIEESDGNEKKQVPASEESPSSSQERPKEFKVETLDMESTLSEHTQDSPSYLKEPLTFSKIGTEMSDQSDDEGPKSDPVEDVTHQSSGGESLKSALDEQSISQVATTLQCDKCQFETRKQNVFFLHQKFHNYKTLKAKYSLLKQEKLEDFLKRKSFLRMSKRDSNVDSLEKFKLPTVCGSCKICFDSEDQMITHLASHKYPGAYPGSRSAKRKNAQTSSVDTKKRAYLCLFCSFRSHDIVNLNIHRKTHTSGKLLSCDLCPNRTTRLCPHKLNGDKIHRCSHCSFRSTIPKMLLLHKKVHQKSEKHKEVKQEVVEQH